MALQVNQTQDKKLITDSIKDINNKFTEHLRNIAAESFKQTKNNSEKKRDNNPWFNWQTRLAKRMLRRSTQSASSFPKSDFLRDNFYKVKGSYKRLLSKCKT